MIPDTCSYLVLNPNIFCFLVRMALFLEDHMVKQVEVIHRTLQYISIYL